MSLGKFPRPRSPPFFGLDGKTDYSLAPQNSFLLRKSTTLYNRRQSKIVSTLTSLFTSCYVFHWSTYFPDTPLLYPPSFDGRIVLYPAEKHVRDYFAWRQADSESHIILQLFIKMLFLYQHISITCTTRRFGRLSSRVVRLHQKPMLRCAQARFWLIFTKDTLLKHYLF